MIDEAADEMDEDSDEDKEHGSFSSYQYDPTEEVS